MPKGCKFCSACNEKVGPRAFVCPKCNTPFVFKNGKVPTEKDINRVKQRREKVQVNTENEVEDEVFDERDHFVKTFATSREKVLFGDSVSIYDSKCGKYRVRAYNNFQGVPACQLYDEPDAHISTVYYQLCKYMPRENLGLVKRFKSFNSVIKYYKDVVEGVREEKLFSPAELNRETRGEKTLKKKKKKK